MDSAYFCVSKIAVWSHVWCMLSVNSPFPSHVTLIRYDNNHDSSQHGKHRCKNKSSRIETFLFKEGVICKSHEWNDVTIIFLLYMNHNIFYRGGYPYPPLKIIGCPSIMTRLKMGKTKHPIVYPPSKWRIPLVCFLLFFSNDEWCDTRVGHHQCYICHTLRLPTKQDHIWAQTRHHDGQLQLADR